MKQKKKVYSPPQIKVVKLKQNGALLQESVVHTTYEP